ncbi:MAG: PH domain-containing protein [Candidatus Aminicenantes bacterium]|nr:MAG: PH domain-containing protein [Candidatus Aminicenantes bacterium]
MEQTLKPDKKLVTKQWAILLVLSSMAILFVLLFQLLLPLSDDVSSAEVSALVWPIAGGVVFVLLFIVGPILVIWVKNLSYIIGEEKITIHKGILTKVQKNIPYRAVTDFIVNRSIFDRFLGIASIRIQTAGQSQTPTGYEGNIAGIVDWEKWHQVLRDRLKRLHPVSEALATRETASSISDRDLLVQILHELRAIRKALEK